MATQTTALPTTRADIFREGLRSARGTITFWHKKRTFGTITLNGPVPVEIFVGRFDFPQMQRHLVKKGCQVEFDMVAGQVDEDVLDIPKNEQTKPCVSKAALLTF